VKAGLILCGIAALGIAQTEAGSPVIEVESREVPVDVIVTGKAAGAVKLTAKDFSIREDGKLQKINSVEPKAADPETSLKHFVLYFDTSAMTVTDQQASKDAARGFVESMASPDRYMAVVNMTTLGSLVLQDFTTSPAALSKAIGGVGLARAPIHIGPQRYDLSVSLAAVCRSMAPASGRKAVLFFGTYYSDGPSRLPAGDRSAFRGGGIEACNRANVGVYTITGYFSPAIDIGGSGGGRMGGRGVVPPVDLAPQSDLAERTGGLAFGITAALADDLAAVAREQDDYYRVFYTPPPSKDGACHELRVSVNVRGLSARARNEYCTERQPDVVAGKIAGESLESRAAGGVAGTLSAAVQLPYFLYGNQSGERSSGGRLRACRHGIHG
jgi:VWFA-related protein